jgi:hypothetical protein
VLTTIVGPRPPGVQVRPPSTARVETERVASPRRVGVANIPGVPLPGSTAGLLRIAPATAVRVGTPLRVERLDGLRRTNGRPVVPRPEVVTIAASRPDVPPNAVAAGVARGLPGHAPRTRGDRGRRRW